MLKYRHPSESDLQKLNEWVAADPDHKDKCTGSYFIPNGEAGTQCIEVSDDQGTVFYLKFTNAVFVDAQFSPISSSEERERIRAGLNEAFAYFSKTLKEKGYHAMLFDSVSPTLIRFFHKLGFRPLLDFFRVSL